MQPPGAATVGLLGSIALSEGPLLENLLKPPVSPMLEAYEYEPPSMEVKFVAALYEATAIEFGTEAPASPTM